MLCRMVAVRSCGQALLWSCCVDLAHGIVWANCDYLLEFAGSSLQTGMPTWRAFTRGAVPGCVTASYAALRDGSVKRRGLPRLDKRTVEDKELHFPDVIHRVGLGDANKALTTPYQDNQAWRSKQLDNCSKLPSRLQTSGQIHVQGAFHKPHGTVHIYAWCTNLMAWQGQLSDTSMCRVCELPLFYRSFSAGIYAAWCLLKKRCQHLATSRGKQVSKRQVMCCPKWVSLGSVLPRVPACDTLPQTSFSLSSM